MINDKYREIYLKELLGRKYLGDGWVLCDYCLLTEMPFISIDHVNKCDECSKEIE